MQLTDIQAVAELVNSRAYRIVLEEIQKDLLEVERRLEAATDQNTKMYLVAEWTAYRKILRKMKHVVDDHAEKLDKVRSENPELGARLDIGRAGGIVIE